MIMVDVREKRRGHERLGELNCTLKRRMYVKWKFVGKGRPSNYISIIRGVKNKNFPACLRASRFENQAFNHSKFTRELN